MQMESSAHAGALAFLATCTSDALTCELRTSRIARTHSKRLRRRESTRFGQKSSEDRTLGASIRAQWPFTVPSVEGCVDVNSTKCDALGALGWEGVGSVVSLRRDARASSSVGCARIQRTWPALDPIGFGVLASDGIRDRRTSVVDAVERDVLVGSRLHCNAQGHGAQDTSTVHPSTRHVRRRRGRQVFVSQWPCLAGVGNCLRGEALVSVVDDLCLPLGHMHVLFQSGIGQALSRGCAGGKLDGSCIGCIAHCKVGDDWRFGCSGQWDVGANQSLVAGMD